MGSVKQHWLDQQMKSSLSEEEALEEVHADERDEETRAIITEEELADELESKDD
jgi:hypothetical protein